MVCVKINNDELFCNAFPFENSWLYFWIDLDVVHGQWRINNGAIGARAPGPRAPGGPQIPTKNFF